MNLSLRATRLHLGRIHFSLVFSGLILFGLSACSALVADEEKLDEGRCNFHTDCQDGQRCQNTYCEDVYYPRRDIKPY
jgi:hypothetical protein